MNNQCYLTSVIRIQVMLYADVPLLCPSLHRSTKPLIAASHRFVPFVFVIWSTMYILTHGSVQILPAAIFGSPAAIVYDLSRKHRRHRTSYNMPPQCEQKLRSHGTPRLRALKVTVHSPTAPRRPYQPESSRIIERALLTQA